VRSCGKGGVHTALCVPPEKYRGLYRKVAVSPRKV